MMMMMMIFLVDEACSDWTWNTLYYTAGEEAGPAGVNGDWTERLACRRAEREREREREDQLKLQTQTWLQGQNGRASDSFPG